MRKVVVSLAVLLGTACVLLGAVFVFREDLIRYGAGRFLPDGRLTLVKLRGVDVTSTELRVAELEFLLNESGQHLVIDGLDVDFRFTSVSSAPVVDSVSIESAQLLGAGDEGGDEAEEAEPEAEQTKATPVPRPIIENTHTIELDRFVPREEIDARYLLAPYYLAPRDEISLEAYSVIREAMSHEGLVGMGRVVLSNRERPLIVEPMGLGLRAFTLHYAHEVRSEADYFADIRPLELPEEVVDVTQLILNTKREHFDPTYLEDRYRTVLVEKLREKSAKLPAKAQATRPSAQNVINLMDALKASLSAAKPPAPSKGRETSSKRTGSKQSTTGPKASRTKRTG